MATLTINGRKVTVDDSFKSLSPEQQEATVNEIAASFAPTEKPIEQGDWAGLASRVSGAATKTAGGEFGPVTESQMSANRQEEARRQGSMYGAERGAGETGFRSFGNQLFLGGPRLSEAYLPSWLGGQSELPGADAHEFIKAADEARSKANPKAAIAGALAGAVPQALILRNPTALANTAMGRAAGGAMVGAAAGGVEQAVESRGDVAEAAKGAGRGLLFGLGGSLAGEALAKGVSSVAGLRNARPAVPSLDDLKTARDAAYARARDINPIYDNAAVKQAATNLEQRFASDGADPALQPGAFVALNRLLKDADSGTPVTGVGLETIRRVAGNAYQPGNKSNNALARAVADEIDNVIGSQGATLGGNAKVAADAIKEARDLHSRVRKSEVVDDLLERAGVKAASAHSGSNIENSSRQELRRLLLDQKKTRGFTDDEMSALTQAVLGTPTQNAARVVGKLFPTTGLGGLIAGGGSVGALGPAGLAIPAIGAAAKKSSESMQNASVSRLAELIRAGGDKSALQVAPNAVQRIAENGKIPLIAALLAASSTTSGLAGR